MKEKRIRKIKASLAILQEKDKACEIFGSSSHRYETKLLVEEEVLKFEKSENIRLPEEFRLFLLSVGYGAGPDYGIYSLKKMQEEYRDFCGCFDEESSMSDSFTLTNKDAMELINLKKQNPKEYHYKRLNNVNGLLPIQTEGCTYFALLVLNGEQKGKIWAVDTNEFDTLPAGLTKELDFLSWYERWLNNAIEKMVKKEEKLDKTQKHESGIMSKKKSIWARIFGTN